MKDGVESLGRIRAQGVAILVLTFVVGVLVGFAGERVRSARRAAPPPVPPEMGPGVVGRFPQGNLPTMFRELNLTPEQVRQIAAILENGRPRSDAVMLRLRSVTDSIRQELRGVLTPEQAARLDSLETHMRRGRMREGMPGRRGGRGEPQPPIP
jgi:Spy/CpxP family protein refolding chaperone